MKKNYSIKKKKKKEVWESENLFYLKSDYSRISKFIYHYEIYKKILELQACSKFDVLKEHRFQSLYLLEKY